MLRMAPKRSRKVVGTVVKTTKKVVQEILEVSVDVEAAGSEELQKATEVVVEEKGVDGVPVVGGLPSAKEIVGAGVEKGREKKNERGGQIKAKDKTGQEQGKVRVPEALDAKGIEKKRGRDGAKRRRRKRRGSNVGVTSGGYKRYVFRVLKQVHPGMGASSQAMSVLEGMMVDMFERIAEEAARLSKYTGKVTISSREIQDAVRLVLPGELGKHAISEGVKAVKKYMDAD